MNTAVPPLPATHPTVAISYSWDSEDHKDWVLNLANLLQKDGAVNVLLDRYELHPGKAMTHFMEQAVDKADKVLLIMTPAYKDKADKRTGGAGFETSMISQQLYENQTTTKFIPIVRQGDYHTASPIFVKPYLSLDMTRDADFAENFKTLVRAIYERPAITRPPLGPLPDFISASPAVNFYQPGDIIDENKDMADNKMPYFAKWIIKIRLRSLSGQSNFSLYNLLTTNMVRYKGNPSPLVYMLTDRLKVGHYPALVFDLPDQNPMITNVFDHERLSIDNGLLHYEFVQYSNQSVLTPRIRTAFGTILYLLLILRKAHAKAKKSPDLHADLHFRANQRSLLNGSYGLIPIPHFYGRWTMHIPGSEAQRSMPISDLSDDRLFEFVQELYGIFAAEDPHAPVPYIDLERAKFDEVLGMIE